MGRPITSITIVGGGTAGWIAAAYLNHRLQWGLTGRHDVKITVIESGSIGTVGVGEATVPSLKGTLRMLEISEAEFMLRTNASFKLGIRFDRWQVDEAGRPYSYVHPFTGGGTVRGRNPGHAFLAYGLPGEPGARGHDFVRTISHCREAIEQMKGPREPDAAPFSGQLQYAYHIDAALLAAFLRETCIERGVEHVVDDVVDISLDARGHIGSLRLGERGDWPVELVIDCTGFRGLLINGALGEPFISYSEYLPNDRAVPAQVMRADQRGMVPATVSRAMDAGWAWRIPLYSRDGAGYVFSSAFLSDDQAIEEFLPVLGDGEQTMAPHILRMRVGRNRRSWVKNCVAIGLSSGFLEPLESTSILSVELACRWLLQYFPSADFEAPLADRFNNCVERLYDEVRDFLGLHYTLSNREDTPYWRAIRHEVKRSESLTEHLALWKHALPSFADPRRDTIFSNWSVQCVLFGKGFYEDADLAGVDLVPEEVWRAYWADRRAAKRSTLAALPAHFDLVEEIRARAVAGETRRRRPKGRDLSLPDDYLIQFATQVMSSMTPARLENARTALTEAEVGVR